MYEYTEFDEIAEQIASDIEPRETMEFGEALDLVRSWMTCETRTVIEGVAVALWRSYQSAEA
jgi:hypothetical protein